MYSVVRRLTFISGFVLLMSSYFVLNNDRMVVHAASAEITSDTEAINAAVAAFQEVGSLRKEDPINADALHNAYIGSLQELVQEADAVNDLSLDSDVLVAIDEIRAGNEPKLAAQVVDKTIQRAFVLTILDRATTVRDEFETADLSTLNQLWDEAVSAFEAIKGTAARDNKVITADRQSIETGSSPALDIQIAEAFDRGRTALNKENPDEDLITIRVERQIIRLSLIRAYYIGVLREVEGIITNRDRDIEEALEKQKEGEIFYRIIEEFITRENATGNELIKSQLVGDLAQVEANAIVSELSRGFIGRVQAELAANATSIASDRGRAMEVAEEALLYANVFMEDLEIRLGSGTRGSLESALNNLKDASNENDEAKAAQARESINEILLVYTDELMLVDYQQTQNTPFVDAAVSAFQTIGVLRRQSPVDAQAIMDAYTEELQQLTQIIDNIYGLALDNAIMAAINNVSSNTDVAQAVQVIDKTLQRVFALTLYNRITLILESFGSLSEPVIELELDRAYSAYLAIKGTAGRDNKVLTEDRQSIESGSNPRLDSQVTYAFIRAKAALNRGSMEGIGQLAIERETIVLSLVRSFFIGVLREVEGIIANRERDIEEALEKQTEGINFYLIVENFVAQHNPVGNEVIKSQLTGDLSSVVADQIVSEISRGLIGHLNDQLTIHGEVLGSNRSQAILTAEIASLYAGMMLPDLELRLGSTKRVIIENALQDLQEASAMDDPGKGMTARQSILNVIAEYEAELF